MDGGKYRLAGVYGDRMDRMAYAQWSLERLRGSEPCVVLASCAERVSGAIRGRGDFRCDGRLVAETVSFSTGAASSDAVRSGRRPHLRGAGTSSTSSRRGYHNRIGGDMYWYNAATGVLQDIYDCAVCERAAASVEGPTTPFRPPRRIQARGRGRVRLRRAFRGRPPGTYSTRTKVRGALLRRSSGEGLPRNPRRRRSQARLAERGNRKNRLGSPRTCRPTDGRATAERPEVPSLLAGQVHQEHAEHGRRNAPATAGAVMSIVTSAVLALEPFVRSRPSGSNVVEELPMGFKGRRFVFPTHFGRTSRDRWPRPPAPGCSAAASERACASSSSREGLRRRADIRASVTLLNDSALDKAGASRLPRVSSRPARPFRFFRRRTERASGAPPPGGAEESRIRRVPCLPGGEWSYRGDVLPEMPGRPFPCMSRDRRSPTGG